jgi:hypothetical protein
MFCQPVNTTRLNKAAVLKRVEAAKNSRGDGDDGGFSEEFEVSATFSRRSFLLKVVSFSKLMNFSMNLEGE